MKGIRKKTTVIRVLLFLLLLLLCGCGAKEEKQEEPEQKEAGQALYINGNGLATVEFGKLTVATSPDFAPYEFYAVDRDGNAVLSGFEVSLAQYVADELHLELKMVPMDFDGTLDAIKNKRVDAVFSGYSKTEERSAFMDFTQMYYSSDQCVITTKDKYAKYSSIEALNSENCLVGSQTGSIQTDLAKEHTPKAYSVELAKVTDLIDELLEGRLDAAFMEGSVAEIYIQNNPQLQMISTVPFESDGAYAGIYKGNRELLQAVDAAITKALESGKMSQFIFDAEKLAEGKIIEGLLE